MKRYVAVILLFMLSACASTEGPQVYRSEGFSLSGDETFRWQAHQDGGGAEKQAREVAAVVRQEVVSALESRGLRQVGGAADLVVRHELIVEMRSVVVGGRLPEPGRSPDAAFNDGRDVDLPEPAVGGRDEERWEVPEGTLMITITDQNNHILWRGWEASAVDMLAIAQPGLAETVREVMSRFP
jgi:hypothetical protein